MNRRGFLSAILATATAPAIVRAESIMRIAPPVGWESGEIWLPRSIISIGEAQRMYMQDELNRLYSEWVRLSSAAPRMIYAAQ